MGRAVVVDNAVVLLPAGQHTPTPQLIAQVERMAAYGIDRTIIAKIIGVKPGEEFDFFYGPAYERGTAVITTAVGDAMVQKAIEGDVRAGALYLRTRGGWAEPKQQVQVSGEIRHTLTADQREKVIESIMSRYTLGPRARAEVK